MHPAAAPTAHGLQQIYGDLWEWTASAYLGYPGYKPTPGAGGNDNGKFMCNQLVLRGGSCATPRAHVRANLPQLLPAGGALAVQPSGSRATPPDGRIPPRRGSRTTMRLPLDRCEIRSWETGDVRSLARHANSRKIWRNVRDQFPFPYSTAHAEVWICTARSVRPEISFAIAVDGQAVGAIGIELRDDVYRRSAEIGYWLGEPWS